MSIVKRIPVKGVNYYAMKGRFLKRGFHLVESECMLLPNKVNPTSGLSVLDCGCSRVEIRTEVFRNPNTGKLNCGKILECKEIVYD